MGSPGFLRESSASALALAKAQEKERAKFTKATPDFPEHVMLTYITKVEEKEGHLILPPFLNNSRVTTVQATDGGQSSTEVAYEFEEELVKGASAEKKHRISSAPTSIDKAFANTQCWFMTILVAVQALSPGATFELSPRTALAYL
jgi:hypothetical protein